MPRALLPSVCVAVLVSLPLVACGADTAGNQPDTEALTDRAVAAIALDHLPRDATSLEAYPAEPAAPDGLVGTRLRYDETAYEIAVYPDDGAGSCAGPGLPRCVEVDSDAGAATLSWDGRSGLVSVSLVRDGELSYLLGAGTPFSGDPRRADLHADVARLVALLEDPRLRLATSPEAVEAGERVEGWEG